MPCLKKRSRAYDHAALSSKKTKKEYQVMDNIGYKEDQWHSMFREIPSQIEEVGMLVGKYVVSMLNSTGGIIAFGVRNTGIIYGEWIARREEDVLKCTIDEAVKRINPCVRYDQYLVKLTPVNGQHFMDYSQYPRKVLEIKVAQGDPHELYEDLNHEAFSRDGSSIVGPLIPHQIKTITIEKLKKKIRVDKYLADFLSPLPKSAWLHKALSHGIDHPNRLKGVGHMVVDRRAVRIKESNKCDASTKCSLNTAVKKKAVEKTDGSNKDVVKCSKSSNNSSFKRAGSVKTKHSRNLVKNASNSKDGDVVETRSSKATYNVANSCVSSVLWVGSSKGASGSSPIEGSLPVEPLLNKRWKYDEKENASLNLTGRAASTKMLVPAEKENASLNPTGRAASTKILVPAEKENASLNLTGRSASTKMLVPAEKENASLNITGRAASTKMLVPAEKENASLNLTRRGASTKMLVPTEKENASLNLTGRDALTKMLGPAEKENASLNITGRDASTKMLVPAEKENASLNLTGRGASTKMLVPAEKENASLNLAGRAALTKMLVPAEKENASLNLTGRAASTKMLAPARNTLSSLNNSLSLNSCNLPPTKTDFASSERTTRPTRVTTAGRQVQFHIRTTTGRLSMPQQQDRSSTPTNCVVTRTNIRRTPVMHLPPPPLPPPPFTYTHDYPSLATPSCHNPSLINGT